MLDAILGSKGRQKEIQKLRGFSTAVPAATSSRPATQAATGRGPPPSDNEMIAMLSGRLRKAEKQLSLATDAINEKARVAHHHLASLPAPQANHHHKRRWSGTDVLIRRLTKQVKLLEGVQQNRESDLSALSTLQDEYRKLQNQVHSMESFLADYGMVWVGDEEDDDKMTSESAVADAQPTSAITSAALVEAATASVSQHNAATATDPEPASKGADGDDHARGSTPPFHVDYDKIIANVHELNVLAGEGVARVVAAPGGGRLEVPEAVPMHLYRNGILLFNGPFRPFSDATTQMCVRDLMDGYFPWELRQRFPDGIPFAIHDHRGQDYQRTTIKAFPGSGYALGGQATTSVLLQEDGPASTTGPEAAQIATPGLQAVSGPSKTQAFLNHLPPTVIRNGCIMDIRQGLAGHLTVQTREQHRVQLVATPVTQHLAAQAAVPTASPQRPTTPRDIATLQVKSEDGKVTLIVKLRFNDSVADVRRCIDQHRGTSVDATYRIYTTYPRKLLDDSSATLLDLDLVPNATLRLVANKSKKV
ncbi:uncharacterized protein MONBRDRAFT_26431 [Monosiga brevicollis MX1]|uniref:UBX domain-containing protein 11 n=1 Tax=Monosiga brevicollis TaxID=81824 RepID=A9V2C6_MONBE|nr:uncharacterized protein MONBRDRAFT_26431 [Monosiga brevicollis MX1]EDQ88234.1 predicted protein [Monosiga brevicollis MX1]|eukprot:XP_001746827.1 hypothetical protein [Monosiga brevicollis MX1]